MPQMRGGAGRARSGPSAAGTRAWGVRQRTVAWSLPCPTTARRTWAARTGPRARRRGAASTKASGALPGTPGTPPQACTTAGPTCPTGNTAGPRTRRRGAAKTSASDAQRRCPTRAVMQRPTKATGSGLGRTSRSSGAASTRAAAATSGRWSSGRSSPAGCRPTRGPAAPSAGRSCRAAGPRLSMDWARCRWPASSPPRRCLAWPRRCWSPGVAHGASCGCRWWRTTWRAPCRAPAAATRHCRRTRASTPPRPGRIRTATP
mmetsp:Transcript_77012/g.198318  ORF Transcript_77012/g.198318 Transcript_77012/m.198318 type:complete len:261 (-) Transcript_77012:44-826(-)